MRSRILLCFDTNLIHEYRKLDQLPWQKIATDAVDLYLSEPVLGELDNHKRDHRTRIRKRALEINAMIRPLVLGGKEEAIIQEKNPRVRLILDISTRPCQDKGFSSFLDYSKADDKIVGIAGALWKKSTGESVALFSDDLGAIAKAKSLEIPFVEIPTSWRRESPEDNADKEIRRLKKEIERITYLGPHIKELAHAERKKVFITKKTFRCVDEADVAELVQKIERNFPKKTDFNSENDGSDARTELGPKYVPPSATKINAYNHKYDNWSSDCQNKISKLHSAFEMIENSKNLIEFSLINNGSQPADHVFLKFHTTGNLLIRQQTNQDLLDKIHKSTSFVSPPLPPAGEWIHDRSTERLARLAAQHLSGDIITPHDLGLNAWNSFEQLNIDPNVFYYKKGFDDGSAVALQCVQWRHGGKPESFELVVSPKDVSKPWSGAVICEVHAANLPTPFSLTVPVELLESEKETLIYAERMVRDFIAKVKK